MAPHNKSNRVISETEIQSDISDIIDKKDLIKIESIGTDYSYKHEIVWEYAIPILLLLLHVLAVWGLFILINEGISYKLALWTLFVFFFSAEGVTVGSHRYFTHRSFKATPLLRAILILCHTHERVSNSFMATPYQDKNPYTLGVAIIVYTIVTQTQMPTLTIRKEDSSLAKLVG
ncbi:unnamed protein product, partial [Brenthis ino]